MSRSKHLDSVARLMESRKHDAARRLGLSRQHRNKQHQRLQELIAYRTEYMSDFQHTVQAGMSALSLQDYHQFLSRLNHAIQRQKQTVEVAEREQALAKQAWLDSRSHSQAITKVIDRYRCKEQYERGKREQRESDECGRSQRGQDRD